MSLCFFIFFFFLSFCFVCRFWWLWAELEGLYVPGKPTKKFMRVRRELESNIKVHFATSKP